MNGFFQDANGDKSSTRLVFIGGFFVSSAVVLALTVMRDVGEGVLGLYLTYCVGGYGLGKMQDTKEKIAEMKSNAAPQTVNVETIENTEQLTKTGDVKINSVKKRRKHV